MVSFPTAFSPSFQHEVNDGTIVMVNSMSGHRVPMSSRLKFYSSTKFAVTALLEGFRQEVKHWQLWGIYVSTAALKPDVP